MVEQLAEPLAFKVKNFYDWHQSRRDAPLTFGYRFAVAFAVDESVIHDPVDGTVGLGPLRYGLTSAAGYVFYESLNAPRLP